MSQDENLAAVVSNAAQDIGSFIRVQREAAQVSVRQLAEKAGVSNPYLSQIERGLRKPSADVLNQIAKALRVSAEVLYIRAGILEPSETNQVRDAIVTDTAINERQKQVLLDIYTSFCQQNEASLAEANTAADAARGDSVSDADEEPATEQDKSPLEIPETPQSITELNLETEGHSHG
ncbi:helix-turn-helix domain-containing protein [Mycobacterium sp. 4D054]|uniref:helix-turn-helix domain-containing protein n=1 Tax=Mycobacterium sp. 4D054 TaxID=3457440 RepID=UPI003FD27B41